MQPRNNLPSPMTRALAILLSGALLLPPAPARQQPQEARGPVIRVYSELVLTNVVVRDKRGNFVRGLKPDNFAILEDNKPQQITSFDVEDMEAAPSASPPE